MVLQEKDRTENQDIIGLLDQTVRFSIRRGYLVVLEGILLSKKYGKFLRRLVEDFDARVFYLDVSFEETLRRHETKPNSHEFGELEMREWYLARDLLNVDKEFVIPEISRLDETSLFVHRIVRSG